MTTENNSLQTQNAAGLPATVDASNYIAVAIQAKQQGFLEANAGMDLDYVRMGQYIKISKKGNFIEARDEQVSYGDTIDVVIAQGEKRYTLWGLEDSPEDGQLIVSHRDEAEARKQLEDWLAYNPEATSRYSLSDIALRYTAFIVPVMANGQPMLGPEQSPTIYLMSFATGDTYGWGQYAMGIYDGKYKAMGVPSNTGVNRVVTRMKTAERKRKGSTDSYLGIDFECLGMFNPADYGITVG